MRRGLKLVGRQLVAGGLILLAGCATVDEGYWASDYPAYPQYAEVEEYRYLNPDGLWVVYDPGLMWYSVAVYPDLYWHDGYYYRRHGGYWERSPRHVGPWAAYRHAPPRVKPRKVEPEWSKGWDRDDRGTHPWQRERLVRRPPSERFARGPLDDRRSRDPRFEEREQPWPHPVSGWPRRQTADRPPIDEGVVRPWRSQERRSGGEPWVAEREPSRAELRSRRPGPLVVEDQGSSDRSRPTLRTWMSRRGAEDPPPPSAGDARDQGGTAAAPDREWLRARQKRPAAERPASEETRSGEGRGRPRAPLPRQWDGAAGEDRPASAPRRFRPESETAPESGRSEGVPPSGRPMVDWSTKIERSEGWGAELPRLAGQNAGR